MNKHTSFQGFESIANHFPNVAIRGTTARSWCPIHQGDGHSSRQNRSLMMRKMPDESVQIVCNAGCQHRDVLAAVGLSWIDTIPDYMRHSRSPYVKPKFEGWPCLQTMDALLVEINVCRICANRMLEGQELDKSDHDALRQAHHRLTEAAVKVSKAVRA